MSKSLSVTLSVKKEDIKDLLYSASSGSSYWCTNAEILGYESRVTRAMRKEGVTIHDGEENKKHKLNIDNITSGLQTMAKKYPEHFADLMSENTDNITSDVFLQCCLFGEVIYG